MVNIDRTPMQQQNPNKHSNLEILIDTGSIWLVFNNVKILLNARKGNSTKRDYTNCDVQYLIHGW